MRVNSLPIEFRWDAHRIIRSVFIFATACLAIFYAVKFSRIGFNPTDDGLILSQSQRLLHGEIPHKDFLSPRPVGSPLVHTLDLLVPLPTIFFSRLLVLSEILITAVLLVHLLFKETVVWRSVTVRSAIVITTMLINLHQFPLMSWHTIDGILFCAIGTHFAFNARTTNARYFLPISAVFIGFSPLIKQSFFPMAIVGILIILTRPEIARKIKIYSCFLIPLPCILYFVWLHVNNATSEALQQLFGGPIPSISTFTESVEMQVLLIAACSISVTIFYLVKMSPRPELMELKDVQILCVSSLAILSYAIFLVLKSDLALTNWSTSLLVLASCSMGITWLISGSRPDCQIVVLAIATMSCISWGYVNPNLVAGGLILVMAVPVVLVAENYFKSHQTRIISRIRFWEFLKCIVALTFLMLLLTHVSNIRESFVYRDLNFQSETKSLSSVSRDLWGIQSNPRTHQFLSDIKSCLSKYPTDRLALLPDGAVVSLLFDKQNPFAIDWWTPYELIVPIENRTHLVPSERGQLVLFQTFPMTSVAGTEALPQATQSSSVFSYPGNLMFEIYEKTPGRTVYCGSLIGKYTPSRNHHNGARGGT